MSETEAITDSGTSSKYPLRLWGLVPVFSKISFSKIHTVYEELKCYSLQKSSSGGPCGVSYP